MHEHTCYLCIDSLSTKAAITEHTLEADGSQCSTCFHCRSFLILRIAIKQVREGVTKDVREED